MPNATGADDVGRGTRGSFPPRIPPQPPRPQPRGITDQHAVLPGRQAAGGQVRDDLSGHADDGAARPVAQDRPAAQPPLLTAARKEDASDAGRHHHHARDRQVQEAEAGHDGERDDRAYGHERQPAGGSHLSVLRSESPTAGAASAGPSLAAPSLPALPALKPAAAPASAYSRMAQSSPAGCGPTRRLTRPPMQRAPWAARSQRGQAAALRDRSRPARPAAPGGRGAAAT